MTSKVNFEILKSRTSLRQVEVLFAVYEAESISLAAKKLQMTAANVSRMCSRFEENCQFKVFARRRKGVKFTEDGIKIISRLAPLAIQIQDL